MIINVHRSSCKVPVSLDMFYLNLNFLDQVSKKCENVKLHENPSAGNRVPCGRTDMTKLLVDFRNFMIAPKMIFYA
jgi:hypothetical protein